MFKNDSKQCRPIRLLLYDVESMLAQKCLIQCFRYFTINPVKFFSIKTDRSEQTLQRQIRPLGCKTSFMLNSAEHEILNAHKYKNIKKFSFF